MEAKLISSTGDVKGSTDINDLLFGLTPNKHVMALAMLREQANARAGSANCKTRAEVRGGGKKPWKQKGTGRARAGSIRSPLWKGGGVIFGPKPRSFDINLPKKVRRLAIKSALSQATDRLFVVDDFSALTQPKTKLVVEMLDKLGVSGKKVLILAEQLKTDNKNLQLSARNIPNVTISLPLNLSVKTLIEADAVIMTKAALQEIEGCLVA
jgi:large subunit ribosomal protein L4